MELAKPATTIYTEIDGICIQDPRPFTDASGAARHGLVVLLYSTAEREGRAIVITTQDDALPHEAHDIPLAAFIPDEEDIFNDWHPSLDHDRNYFTLASVSGMVKPDGN